MKAHIACFVVKVTSPKGLVTVTHETAYIDDTFTYDDAVASLTQWEIETSGACLSIEVVRCTEHEQHGV